MDAEMVSCDVCKMYASVQGKHPCPGPHEFVQIMCPEVSEYPLLAGFAKRVTSDDGDSFEWVLTAEDIRKLARLVDRER